LKKSKDIIKEAALKIRAKLSRRRAIYQDKSVMFVVRVFIAKLRNNLRIEGRRYSLGIIG
jgi:hypothetical protein